MNMCYEIEDLEQLSGTRYIRGVCEAQIFRHDGSSLFVELTYEGEEHEDGGYDIHCTRPEVNNASDLMLDVIVALNDDGVSEVATINWL